MKSIMLSIQPKYCELIANDKKTIEVRKTAPKLETPFKCYIYETQNTKGIHGFTILGRYRLGKVIGEFVCDRLDKYEYSTIDGVDIDDDELLETMLDREEINIYANGKDTYGLHITDLKIYDKPKELGEFWKSDKCPYASDNGCTYNYHCFRSGENSHKHGRCGEKLTRPPQSWCYVEELSE